MQKFQNIFSKFCLVLLSFVLTFCFNSAYLVIDDNPYRHFATLDTNGKYKLEWLVDWNQKRVIFNVTVQTTGYVGFGLIKKPGKMTGADIVIGGVYPNGRSYFSDRHAIANQLPEVDPSQDWKLHFVWERDNYTFLSFSRPFDTCDVAHDLPITDDGITLIWAYGEIDDQVQYHFQNCGTYPTYLLDADFTPRSINPVFDHEYSDVATSTAASMKVFKMTREMVLPIQDTTYWCSFHRVPTTTKHHIIGFNTVLPTDVDRKHTHHILLHRCNAPEDVDPDSFFGDAAQSEGGECYFIAEPNPLPTQYCQETIHVWAVGGRAIFMPKHVGLPMSEMGSEYFLLQVHFDNPDLLPDLFITVEVDVFYTDILKENDAGMLQSGNQIPGSTSIVLPPSSVNHAIIGHCAPGCMHKIIPDGGVRAFASLLHTHITGREVRFLHHRGNQELSWISNDSNYNFNYQQFRILRQERRLLPGDHLMQRCVYDTSDRNGSVVVGGFSTRDETCTGYLYYYPRSHKYGLCRSEIRTEAYWKLLGIQNITWEESQREMVVTSPPHCAGLGVAECLNNYVEWNFETKNSLQRHHQFDPQVSQCPRVDIPPPNASFIQQEQEEQLQQFTMSGNMRFQNNVYYGRSRALIQKQMDDNTEHLSINPSGISRYRKPAQCSGYSKNMNRNQRKNK